MVEPIAARRPGRLRVVSAPGPDGDCVMPQDAASRLRVSAGAVRVVYGEDEDRRNTETRNGDLWDPIWKRVKNAMILRNRYKQA